MDMVDIDIKYNLHLFPIPISHIQVADLPSPIWSSCIPPSACEEIKNLIRWILEVRRVTSMRRSQSSRRWRMWAMATALSGGGSPTPGQHNIQKEASSAQEISFHGRLEFARPTKPDAVHWWETCSCWQYLFFYGSDFAINIIGYSLSNRLWKVCLGSKEPLGTLRRSFSQWRGACPVFICGYQIGIFFKSISLFLAQGSSSLRPTLSRQLTATLSYSLP